MYRHQLSQLVGSRVFTFRIVASCGFALTAVLLHATGGLAQQEKPKLSFEQRVEIARKILEPMEKEVFNRIDVENPGSDDGQSGRNDINYNSPPVCIAVAGLKIVRAVEPSMLDECIDQCIAISKPLRSSTLGNPKKYLFKSIAGLARYDFKKAAKEFEEISSLVEERNQESFLFATLVFHPERFWETVNGIPEKNKHGSDLRTSTLRSMLPVLLKRTDDDFWDDFSNPGAYAIGDSIISK